MDSMTLLKRRNRDRKSGSETEGDNGENKTLILMTFSSTFSALCKNPVVSGEDPGNSPPPLLLPPQAFSNTLHPPGPDTSSLWLSHPNERWGRRDAEAHTHLAQNGPNWLGLKPQSFSKAKEGISPTFPNPALRSCQTTCGEQWGPKTICEWFQRVVAFHKGF